VGLKASVDISDKKKKIASTKIRTFDRPGRSVLTEGWRKMCD
jgi:hypothetical protein